MLLVISSIFVASLLGSLHCAGMCGAFLAIVVGDGSRPSRGAQVAYHLGRLVTYMLLGAIAGGIGQLVDLAGTLAGLQKVAISISAIVMIVFGISSLLTTLGIRGFKWQPPKFLAAFTSRGHQFAMKYGPVARGGLFGLFTTLIPCGWLYAFVAAAAGTASISLGSLTMLVFWSGTLPVMVSLGMGLRGIIGLTGKRVPMITCIALVAIGAVTLFNRNNLSAMTLASRTQSAIDQANATLQPACCRESHD